jgi:hypothetical protein
MKRASRKSCRRGKPQPTPDQIHHYIQLMSDQHQGEWQCELQSSAPHWEYLLGLHLRMIELNHPETASAELL